MIYVMNFHNVQGGKMNIESYHDRLNEPTQLRISYERKARDQEAAVFKRFFRLGLTYSPSQLYVIMINANDISKDTPLTSIRRAITNLTNRGLLSKTDTKVMGKYGRMESMWEKV
jgi:hypothetical protein